MAKEQVVLVHDMRSLRELAQLPKQVAELEKRNLDVVLLSELIIRTWEYDRSAKSLMYDADFVIVMDGLYKLDPYQGIISSFRRNDYRIMSYSAALANLPAKSKDNFWDKVFGRPIRVSNEERAW